MEVCLDDLTRPESIDLVREHLRDLARHSPLCSMHALDLERLRQPDITLWSVWHDSALLGCGGLKELDPSHGEIKSMRTAPGHLRKGVATRLVQHIVQEATRRGYRRLSLETGAMAAFAPAHRLYAHLGFAPCGPFADYTEDPNSVFMTMTL